MPVSLEEDILRKIGRCFPVPRKPEAPPGDLRIVTGKQFFDGRAFRAARAFSGREEQLLI